MISLLIIFLFVVVYPSACKGNEKSIIHNKIDEKYSFFMIYFVFP